MEDAPAPPNPAASPLALRDDAVTAPKRSLAEILDRLPTDPGVYLMRDRRGSIVYVGKAANLRARVRQYFQPSTGDTRDFVPLLDSIVDDIETVVTSNEKEALLLENTLIKKHQPRFNVKLTDDKNFLVLRLDPKAEWPRLEVGRKIRDDGAYYFGPYHSASQCREALRVVNRHFQLRTCTDHVLHNRRRPCLQYQIKRCPGPCVLPVSPDDYAEQVRDVRLFLENKDDELLGRLRDRMKQAAQALEFERAAAVRDQVRALESSLQAQRVVSRDFVDQDAIGFHREGIAVDIVVVPIRAGKMLGTRPFSFTRQEFPDAEILSTFLGLYYDLNPAVPDEVLLPFAIDDIALKAEWLSDLRRARGGELTAASRRVQVLVPQRGPRAELVELARKNAAATFASRRSAERDAEETLAKLQRRLRLPTLPRVIECYDISHIQGTETVASMVVFVDGKPDKTRYRTFKVRHSAISAGNPDDFASMYEVLSRRFRRARTAVGEDSESGESTGTTWTLPDLIVVDGGKGQLGMALAAARDVGVDTRWGQGLPIIGLAKERDSEAAPADADVQSESGPSAPDDAPQAAAPKAAPAGKDGATVRRPDRVFLPHAKDAIPIRANSAEMFVLQQLRDEAHRFAVTFHRNQRRRRTLRSALSDVPGIGPTRQRTLLRHFGSLKKIRDASLEDLLGVPGMNRKTAEAVLAHFATAPTPLADRLAPSPEVADEDAVESAFAELEATPESSGELADGAAGELRSEAPGPPAR